MLMKLNSMSTKLINVRNSHISLSKKNMVNGKNIKSISIEDIKIDKRKEINYVKLTKPYKKGNSLLLWTTFWNMNI